MVFPLWLSLSALITEAMESLGLGHHLGFPWTFTSLRGSWTLYLGDTVVKNLPANAENSQETQVQSLG